MSAGEMILLGLLGSLHCWGMCGGLALGFSGSPWFWRRQLAYQGGRLLAYAVAGALAGGMGQLVGSVALGPWRLALGLWMIWMGLGLAGAVPAWTPGWLPRGFVLSRLGAGLRAPGVASGFLLGLITGCLPCGLLYAALARSAAAPDAWSGAAMMAFFWLGTAPSLWALHQILPRLSGRLGRLWPLLAGGTVILLGIATALGPAEHNGCH